MYCGAGGGGGDVRDAGHGDEAAAHLVEDGDVLVDAVEDVELVRGDWGGGRELETDTDLVEDAGVGGHGGGRPGRGVWFGHFD